MRWYLKSAGFKLLSALPGGDRLYRFAQDHCTGSSQATPERVRQKVEVGLTYWRWLKQNQRTQALRAGTLLDFGAGWHPTIPLLFYSLGVPRQHLLDLTPWFTSRQVLATASLVADQLSAPAFEEKEEVRRLPRPANQQVAPVAELLQQWGLRYHAPYLPDVPRLQAVADVALCTQVLLHIPPAGLRNSFAVLRECLKPGGVFLGTVHLMDLYSHADARITPYNHLKFSARTWERWVNSDMMPFNRLKARDYLSLLGEAGFRIIHQEVNVATEADYRELDQVKIHPEFARYTRDELVAKHLFFVAERP